MGIEIIQKPERSAVSDVVKQFGSHCMAYSTLQPGLKYHFSPGIGFIAYAEIGPLNPETEAKAHELESLARHIKGKIQKVIFVPGRLINFVV